MMSVTDAVAASGLTLEELTKGGLHVYGKGEDRRIHPDVNELGWHLWAPVF